ncbi:hypothetical protein [Halorubrum coriense]|uniref:hypothetical protein n=1 Tax=Halorubrum coriense TaxID=64713 RepID=UPI0012698427|nr:hypothetical protein [Halorubrum coriense]
MATLTSVGLAGCTTLGDSQPPNEDELPDQCPTSRDLDVPWPRDLDPGLVRGFITGYEDLKEFITAYEEAYLVEKSTQSPYQSANFNVNVDRYIKRVVGGFLLTVSHTGSVKNQSHLLLRAFKTDSEGIPKDGLSVDKSDVPDGLEPIPINEVQDQKTREILKSAAKSGDRTDTASPPGQFYDLVNNRSPNASLSDEGRSGVYSDLPAVYFDVNGTVVLVFILMKQGSVGDIFEPVSVQYYVSEYVIRRTEDESKSPRDGTVVECRLPE